MRLYLRGDRVAKRLRAPGDGVLIHVVGDGVAGGVLQDFGGGEIGKSLRQVDGVVLARQGATFRG